MELYKVWDEEGNINIPEDEDEWDDYYYIISKLQEEQGDQDGNETSITLRRNKSQ